MKRMFGLAIFAAVLYGAAGHWPKVGPAAAAAAAYSPATSARAVNLATVIATIEHARRATVSAYTLSPRSAMLAALRDASDNGAIVDLVLTGDGLPYAIEQNHRIAERWQGAHVVLTREPLHLKAAIIDSGSEVFVSDENWSRGGLIVQIPSQYAIALARAMIGDAHDDGDLTTTKASSLRAEAHVIDDARTDVALESESFGSDNPVYDALERALQRGVQVSVVVASREYEESAPERDALAILTRSGARVRTTPRTDKLLLTDHATWIGSANASSGVPEQVDWGYTATNNASLRAVIATRIQAP